MVKILGVKIDKYDFCEVMTKIRLFLQSKKCHQIVTVNPEFVLAAQKDREFKKALNNADLSIPDGFGLKIAAALLNQKIGERLTGVDLTWELAKLASERGYSIFFLGAAPGVAQKATKNIKILYPNLKIAGTYAGGPNDKATLDILKRTKCDILLVAFGAPAQDKFIYNLISSNSKSIYSSRERSESRSSADNSSRPVSPRSRRGGQARTISSSNLPRIAVGVGGTFDYIASIIPRAPQWMRKLGLEWLYRLFRQPRRLPRILRAVIIFPALVLYRKFIS